MGEKASEESFQHFKRTILYDAAFEDWQGMWEPLWWLRGGGRIEGQSEADRQAFAERALRELYADGLIFFVRVPFPADITDVENDPSLRLSPDDVDATL